MRKGKIIGRKGRTDAWTQKKELGKKEKENSKRFSEVCDEY